MDVARYEDMLDEDLMPYMGFRVVIGVDTDGLHDFRVAWEENPQVHMLELLGVLDVIKASLMQRSGFEFTPQDEYDNNDGGDGG
jgi:hypothetical protein